MKYYKNEDTGQVFGFDETDETQLPYMQEKIDAGFKDISDNWPLLSEPVAEEAIDPAEKLKMFLAMNPDVLDLIN